MNAIELDGNVTIYMPHCTCHVVIIKDTYSVMLKTISVYFNWKKLVNIIELMR